MATYLGERCVEDALQTGKALLKYISPNDVGLTGGHQCGYYLPKNVWELYTDNPPEKGSNAESFVSVQWQDGRVTNSRIIWYGKETRSEYRMTRFGRNFPYLTHDNVGDLLVLIPESKSHFRAYVLDLDEDMDDVQASLGVQLIRSWGVYDGSKHLQPETADQCIDRMIREFTQGVQQFPNTKVMSDEARRVAYDCLPNLINLSSDERLLMFLDTEYKLFRVVERLVSQKEIVRTFKDVDDFVNTASRIMNRRKSRAGKALENHVEALLRDAKIPFDAQGAVDGQPDFIVPCVKAYNDAGYPASKLFMIGVKTTCKDRWRQVLNEARRIPRKHILTIQHGVSPRQLDEMRRANVQLIVPQGLHSEYPKTHRAEIQSIENFLSFLRQELSA